MWKKLIILAGVVGVAAIVAKKVKSMNEERALWHEATTSAEDVNLRRRTASAKIQDECRPWRLRQWRHYRCLTAPARGLSSIGRASLLQGEG